VSVKPVFTIAPEAGTQRLRDIINKNLTEESIAKTVENALSLGWKNIKLYFMTGLPFEQMDDIQGIADLSQRLASKYTKGKQMINVSVTCFIPKAHTPFQRHAQMTLEQTREKLQYLKDNLRHPKVNLKWQDPKMSLLEGVWARGDRSLSPLLVKAFELGCRLDGWSDRSISACGNRPLNPQALILPFIPPAKEPLANPCPGTTLIPALKKRSWKAN
jgi:Fe-S oxidoreductase